MKRSIQIAIVQTCGDIKNWREFPSLFQEKLNDPRVMFSKKALELHRMISSAISRKLERR